MPRNIVVAILACLGIAGCSHRDDTSKAESAKEPAKVTPADDTPKFDDQHWVLETTQLLVHCWGKPIIEGNKVTYRDWYDGRIMTVVSPEIRIDTFSDPAHPELEWKDGRRPKKS